MPWVADTLGRDAGDKPGCRNTGRMPPWHPDDPEPITRMEERLIITRRSLLVAGLSAGTGIAAGCVSSGLPADAGWVTLIDGPNLTNLDGWSEIGQGNWSIVDGMLQGRNGNAGYLVSKDTFLDFEMRVEFWADADANSGVFLRCQDRQKVGADNAYEVNIWDRRPDQTYGTGAIVNVAKVAQPAPRAAGRWNTFEISARGDHLVVVLNGQKTADVSDGKHRRGPFALQSAAGTIRFRKVQIREV